MQQRMNRSGVFAAVTLAAALSGCANSNVFDQNERWFSRSFDWTGRNGGYTYSELQDSQEKQRPVTPADLVDANGGCAPAPAAPAAPPVAAAQGPGVMPTAPSADPLLGQGIALGMTECEVVYRAGAPSAVQIGSGPHGGRTAVLTFNEGPRAGIYRFEGGRLMDMDGLQTTASVSKTAKRVARKRPQRAPTEQISTE